MKPVAWCVGYNDKNVGETPSNPTIYNTEAEAVVRNNPTKLYLIELFTADQLRAAQVEILREAAEKLAPNGGWVAIELRRMANELKDKK